MTSLPTNQSQPLGPAPDPPPLAESVTVCLVLGCLAVCAILGNSLVLYVVGKHLKCLSLTNAFLVSLSISDLLAAITCLPMTVLDLFLGDFLQTNEICIVNAFFNSLSGISSAFLLTCVAADRYYALGGTPRVGLGQQATAAAIVVSWLVAVPAAVPWYALSQLQDPSFQMYLPGSHHCMYVFHYQVPKTQLIYNATVTLLYLGPLVVMMTCSVRLWGVVRRHHKQVCPITTQPTQVRFTAELRTARTLLLMVLVFLLTKGLYLLLGMGLPMFRQDYRHPVDLVAIILFWCNCAANPVIYAVRNPNFTEVLHIRRRPSHHKPTSSFTNLAIPPSNTATPDLCMAKRMSIFTSRGSFSTAGDIYEVESSSCSTRDSLPHVHCCTYPYHNTWMAARSGATYF